MAEPIFDVRQGRRVYSASGTITAGMFVAPTSTPNQVVASPTIIAPCLLAVTSAVDGADVEVVPIVRGAEYRVLCGATSISAGAEIAIGATTEIGKAITYASGVKAGRALEAAASGGLMKIIAYWPTLNSTPDTHLLWQPALPLSRQFRA